MKELKMYQQPAVLIISINRIDILTVSDNDADWDPAWNGIIS